MNKYKICVYAICKNEENKILSWYNSMKEADEIYVLDTGSTDNSVSILKSLGVNVTSTTITPWRFDIARNLSLDLVPLDTDICVCTDIDEVFNPGWRQVLESIWQDNTTRIKYIYNWHFDKYNNPDITFYLDKIHNRLNYSWIYPVHEVLKSNTKEHFIYTKDIILNHHQEKKKSRSNYLPLLELSIKENPLDERNLHYLGREYMYYKKYNKAISTLKKHLEISTWNKEKCASLRFIAKCYLGLKNNKEAKKYLKKAIKLSPNTREPYIDLGFIYYTETKYKTAIKYIEKALKIKTKDIDYIQENYCYNSFPYDILSICYFNIQDYDKSYMYASLALLKDPNNKRIKNNLKLIKKYLKGN